MGLFIKALENTIPEDMKTGAEKIALGGGEAALGAVTGAAITPELASLAKGIGDTGLKGVTVASEHASNAAAPSVAEKTGPALAV